LSRAKARAVARPIPVSAPVTKTTGVVIRFLLQDLLSFRIRRLGSPIQSTGTASDTSARAALAQSSSFCTVGAPLSPIAPTTSPLTLVGNPPPNAAPRASAGRPA